MLWGRSAAGGKENVEERRPENDQMIYTGFNWFQSELVLVIHSETAVDQVSELARLDRFAAFLQFLAESSRNPE